MHTVRRTDGWWIEGVPHYEADGQTHASCGPYQTKAEAEADRRGMERTLGEIEVQQIGETR